ncbi:hypothetical protein BC828DRAFT_384139 [Blastocladiella britannica]|nr:hypothetical protein BC828DRAFT_384139 [Blastocladiella britannica]
MQNSITGKVHLAWCLGKSGTYLGTHIENTNFASYNEPGPDNKPTTTKSFTFMVLTGNCEDERIHSHWSIPHPKLEWRQRHRTNSKDAHIVQFATSAGVVMIARPPGTSTDLGLDFLPPTAATDAFVLVRNEHTDFNLNADVIFDAASSRGDITALNTWVEIGLSFVYSQRPWIKHPPMDTSMCWTGGSSGPKKTHACPSVIHARQSIKLLKMGRSCDDWPSGLWPSHNSVYDNVLYTRTVPL